MVSAILKFWYTGMTEPAKEHYSTIGLAFDAGERLCDTLRAQGKEHYSVMVVNNLTGKPALTVTK